MAEYISDELWSLCYALLMEEAHRVTPAMHLILEGAKRAPQQVVNKSRIILYFMYVVVIRLFQWDKGESFWTCILNRIKLKGIGKNTFEIIELISVCFDYFGMVILAPAKWEAWNCYNGLVPGLWEEADLIQWSKERWTYR